MSRPTESPADTNPRRKLLRGVFAAPALMTVCSGSAFAAASNFNCISKTSTEPLPALTEGATEVGTWMRTLVYTKNSKNYVKGAEVASQTPLSTTHYRLTAAPNYNLNVDQTSLPNLNALQPTNPKIWVLVRYDEAGVAIGFGSQQAGSYPVGTSCWSSFA